MVCLYHLPFSTLPCVHGWPRTLSSEAPSCLVLFPECSHHCDLNWLIAQNLRETGYMKIFHVSEPLINRRCSGTLWSHHSQFYIFSHSSVGLLVYQEKIRNRYLDQLSHSRMFPVAVWLLEAQTLFSLFVTMWRERWKLRFSVFLSEVELDVHQEE